LPQPISQPPEPLVSAVLAVLKAANELDCEMNRTKLAKLLYFADLRAVEEGGTAFSGATWRWRNYGPYDNALMRAERIIVSADLAEIADERGEEGGACKLALTVDDLGDPLSAAHMEIVRAVVREYGAEPASALRRMSYQTAPMVEAQTAGDREVVLNLSRARRARQAKDLIARQQRQRAAMGPSTRDHDAPAAIAGEYDEFRDLRRRANAAALGDGE
jgi:uncharacterized phage-associated protein